MSEFLSCAAIFYAVFYLLVTVIISAGLFRLRKSRHPEMLPRVSVVLCARNEERNLPRCLERLSQLDYPAEKLEINLVDDESGDRTLEIFHEYAARDSRFRVFNTKDEPRTLIGKQRPLNMGIRESGGEIVLIVDADIAVRPDWVRAHVSAYRGNVGVAGGITRVDPSGGGLFARVQAADLITKISVVAGSAGLGIPLTIMGNNISFRRKAYDAVGGFEKMKPRIVEDLALMNAITRDAGYRLGWASGPGGVVDSMPEDAVATFIEQRRRWLAEVDDMSFMGRMTIWLESIMYGVFLMTLALAAVSASFLPVSVVAAAWCIGYALLLSVNPGATLRDFFHVPLMLLFQSYYAAIIGRGMIAGRKKVVWKGREYV